MEMITYGLPSRTDFRTIVPTASGIPVPLLSRERALALGQKIEVIEDAERRIAEYEKKHGKPMSRTGQAMWMLRGLVEVYDKSLLS